MVRCRHSSRVGENLGLRRAFLLLVPPFKAVARPKYDDAVQLLVRDSVDVSSFFQPSVCIGIVGLEE